MFKAHAFVTREALSDTLSMTYTFSAMDRLRHQQDIALYSLGLYEQAPGYTEGAGREAWLNDPVCQGPAAWSNGSFRCGTGARW